jgi:hypothetical protein
MGGEVRSDPHSAKLTAVLEVLLERCQHHAVKVKSTTRFSSLPRMTTDPLLRLITSPLLRLITSQLMLLFLPAASLECQSQKSRHNLYFAIILLQKFKAPSN